MTFTIRIKGKPVLSDSFTDDESPMLAQIIASHWRAMCEAGGFSVVVTYDDGISKIVAQGEADQ